MSTDQLLMDFDEVEGTAGLVSEPSFQAPSPAMDTRGNKGCYVDALWCNKWDLLRDEHSGPK